MEVTRLAAGIAILSGLLIPAVPARAEVLFQNAGTLAGWDRIFIQHQGTVTQVEAPAYQGGTALKMTQTFQGIDGVRYHSEVIKNAAQKPGTDVYYGQALYLPPDWEFHNANETFQQLAPDDNSGPWILMYVQKDHLYVTVVRTSIAGARDLGSISGLRGTWIRIVMRIVLSSQGTMEVWVNGEKVHSEKGNFNPHSSGSIRWSNGVYATRWIKEQPVGPRTLVLLHDHLRAATTYAEADPASWQEEPGTADGGVTADAGNDTGSPAQERDAAWEASVAEPRPVDARRAPADVAPTEPPDDAEASDDSAASVARPAGGGCTVAPHTDARGLALLMALLLARAVRRCFAPRPSRQGPVIS